MIGLRRRGLAITGAAVLTAGLLGVAPATTAVAATTGTPFAQAQFGAYGTGSEVHIGAVTSGTTSLAQVEQAFSANTVNSGGLTGQVNSPITKALVQTDQTANAANAYGRGSGLELGLAQGITQPNAVQLGIVEAHAPPPSGLIQATAIPLDLRPLLVTGLLHGAAAAAYNSTFCPVGQPLAYGQGDASAPTAVLSGTPPLVSGTGASGTQAAQSRTRTDFVANADGTFGIANTVQEIITPLTINLGPSLTLAVTVQGDGPDSPLTFTTYNDGEGHAGVTSANTDPLVKIDLITTVAGIQTTLNLVNVKLSLVAGILNPLLGTGSAIQTLLAGLGVNLSVDVGVQAHPAGAASLAYDLLAINASIPASGLTVADVRLGHVESQVVLPNGPIACTIPVAKNANPPSITAGNSFTWTISIPSSATALNDSTCDLTNIKATDVVGVKPGGGTPTFTITAISNNGTYNASTKTITWANLGNYHPGDPPIVLTVTVAVPASSPAGTLQDIANVSAGLGNCTGGATGLTSLIGANVGNAILTGTITLQAPKVNAGNGGNNNLAATGNGPLLAWAGALLLVIAVGTRRILRRADSHS